MKRLARGLLHLLGWRVEGERPDAPRYLLVGAPHTSSWDLPLLLLLAWAIDLPIRWMAKHTLFLPPLGWILRALGGIPIERSVRENTVETVARAFRDADELVLVIAPEATKDRRTYWRSGFYHIARTTPVPVVPAALDYGRRVAVIGPVVEATDDVDAFMEQMRAFYAGAVARFPGLFTPVRLREEDEATAPDRDGD